MEYDTSAPVDSFARVVRHVLLRPASFFASITPTTKEDEERVRAAMWFVVACSLVFVVLAGAYEILAAATGPGISVIGFFGLEGVGAIALLAPLIAVLVPLLMLIQLYIGAFLLHIPVMIFVGPDRRSYHATLKIYAYLGVTLLVAWVPVAWLVASLYQAYLAAAGVRELHRTNTVRATIVGLVVLAWSVLFLVLDPASILRGGFG